MDKHKKSFGALLAMAMFALHLIVPVAALAESEKVSPFQGGNRAGIHASLDFFGTKPCRITASTTATLCASGEGVLDAICASGGTLGQYSLGLDSAVAGSRSVTNSDSLVLSPMVFTHTDTGSSPGGLSCWAAKEQAGGPVRFVNGLVGVQSHAGHTTLLFYHKTDGSNP